MTVEDCKSGFVRVCELGFRHTPPCAQGIMPLTQHMVPALLFSPFVICSVSVFAREVRMKMVMADYSKWLAPEKFWRTTGNVQPIDCLS